MRNGSLPLSYSMIERLAGIVLAGGQSRRLGHDKALHELADGRPLLAHVVEKLQLLCGEVLVVTDRPGKYADLRLSVRWVVDTTPNQGPLAGIQAGMAATQSPFALVVACDMPFLSLDLLRYMASLDSDYDALVPFYRGRWHPLHAIYARRILPVLEERLAQGRRQLQDLLKELRLRPLRTAEIRRFDPHGWSLFNLNTAGDLARARAIAQRLGAIF